MGDPSRGISLRAAAAGVTTRRTTETIKWKEATVALAKQAPELVWETERE
jgi:hypothetical protein